VQISGWTLKTRFVLLLYIGGDDMVGEMAKEVETGKSKHPLLKYRGHAELDPCKP
jgi:hypothetical protein